MSRLSVENTALAQRIITRYPRSRSALIPLLHVAQEQDGWLTTEAMEHVAELLDLTPAEVLGTASFYGMFKLEPVGRYLVNVCTSISCLLNGGDELLAHCEERLGIKPGSTSPDGMFSLDEVECIAACTEAPCLQVNYRYFHSVTHDEVSLLFDELRLAGRRGEIPAHGMLTRVRQEIPSHRWAGNGADGLAPEPGRPGRARATR